jgi:ligand-binding SRPBCC domain-containing protein
MKTRTLEFSVALNVSLKELFEFHLDFDNISKVTPPWIKTRIVRSPEILTEGSELSVQVRQFGVWIPWDVSVVTLRPYTLMIDVQTSRGPFALWRHEHRFSEVADRVVLTDVITYALPLGFLGRCVDAVLFRHVQKKVFDYRHSRMQDIFNRS